MVMGNTIKWQIPDSTEATYDNTEIYRSDAKDGTYSLLATQVIADNTYFDIDGTTSSWYKVRFKLASGPKYSSYSKPIRGGTAHGYCTVDDLRLLTGLTSTQISDSDLLQIQKFAITHFNGDVGRWFYGRDAEKVLYIDEEKENIIDGLNRTFYLKEIYVGDMNCDGVVDEDDVSAYTINSSGVRTNYTITVVDPSLGQFMLSVAPTSTEQLYVEYMSIPYQEDPPHMLIKQAISALVSATAATKINPTNARMFTVGKIKLDYGWGMTPFKTHYERYKQFIQIIKRRALRKTRSEPVRFGDVVIMNTDEEGGREVLRYARWY